MSNYWANFIRTGNPNKGSELGVHLPYFPPTVAEKKECMWLGNSWGNGPLSSSYARIEFIERWEATLQEW
jgi:carboxylesterase 2